MGQYRNLEAQKKYRPIIRPALGTIANVWSSFEMIIDVRFGPTRTL
jgi:hypothetical protein